MEAFLAKSQKYWAFFLLPVINICAWFMADPLYENMTHIAYANHHFPFVLLWASTCAGYLWTYTLRFMKQIGYPKKSVTFLLTLSCLLMIVSVCIPYQAAEATWSDHLHVDVAMASTIAYILIFLYTLCRLFTLDPPLWRKVISPYLAMITLLLMLLLLLGCVSTLMETLFVIFMGIYLWWLQHKLNPK